MDMHFNSEFDSTLLWEEDITSNYSNGFDDQHSVNKEGIDSTNPNNKSNSKPNNINPVNESRNEMDVNEATESFTSSTVASQSSPKINDRQIKMAEEKLTTDNTRNLSNNLTNSQGGPLSFQYLDGFITTMSDQSYGLPYDGKPNLNNIGDYNPSNQKDFLNLNTTSSQAENQRISLQENHANTQISFGNNPISTDEIARDKINESNLIQNSFHQINYIEPIYPPNYFLSGMTPWEPNPVLINTSSTWETRKNSLPLSNSSNIAKSAALPDSISKGDTKGTGIYATRRDDKNKSNVVPMNYSKDNIRSETYKHGSLNKVHLHPDSSLPLNSRCFQSTSGMPLQHNSSNGSVKKQVTSSDICGVSSISNSKSMNEKRLGEAIKEQEKTQPFHLFDAPCELRTNYLKCQKALNMQTVPDNNSYHYDLATNRFILNQLNNTHRSDLLQTKSKFDAVTLSINDKSVKLVDSRHRREKARVSERNEREQQRAQKITELIEKLRLTMVEGGWKVEMKSKYHTLSTCTEYVKYLIKINREKEFSVEKAKLDLEDRKNKLAEEKSLLENRSDPESVTSSLSASTTDSVKCEKSHLCISKGTDASREEEIESSEAKSNSHKNKKRTLPALISNDESNADDSSSAYDHSSTKKIRNSTMKEAKSHDMKSVSVYDHGTSGINVSCHKTSTNLSEMRDNEMRNSVDKGKDTNIKPSSNTSSTAAIVSGVKWDVNEHPVVDVLLMKRSKSRKRCLEVETKGLTSLDKEFQLDYEEVFVNSNVPQLISSISGRIISYNNFFLTVTGLTRQKIQNLNIFSLVHKDKLSSFFEYISTCLNKKDKDLTCSSDDAKCEKKNRLYDSQTMLCTRFLAKYDVGTKKGKPLLLKMKVTLITDVNNREPYLLSTFSDSHADNDSGSYISPDLLNMHFSKYNPSSKVKKEDAQKDNESC